MPEWEIAPIDRTDPPVDGTATFHATRLTALLDERLTEKYATWPEERAILDQNRMPYDSVVNAVGVMRQWTALQGCGVIALLFQPDGGVVYNQKEEAPRRQVAAPVSAQAGAGTPVSTAAPRAGTVGVGSRTPHSGRYGTGKSPRVGRGSRWGLLS